MIYEDKIEFIKVSKTAIFTVLSNLFPSFFSDKLLSDLIYYGPATDSSFVSFVFKVKEINSTLSEQKTIRIKRGEILSLLVAIDPINFTGRSLDNLLNYEDDATDPTSVVFTFKVV